MSRSIWELDFKDAITGGLSKVTKGVDQLFGKIAVKEAQAETQINSLGSKFSGLTGILAGIGAGVSIAGIMSFSKDSVAAYNEQQRALALVKSVIESTGGAAGRTAQQLQAQAEAMEMLTQFGDDQVMTAQSVLLTFKNIHGEVFDRTVPVLADMATIMGTDMKSAALQVGKAMNDPVSGLSALGRAGVQFNDIQTETIKKLAEGGNMAGAQAIILKELESQFGGAAKAAADANPFEQWTDSMDNFKEMLGMEILPMLSSFLGYAGDALGFISSNFGVIKDLFTSIAIAAGIAGTAYLYYNGAAILASVATWALNAALAVNPFVLIGIAIGAAVFGIIQLWKNFEGFRAFLSGFGATLKDLVLGPLMVIAGIATGNLGWIQEGMKRTVGAISGDSYSKASDQARADFRAEKEAEKEKETTGSIAGKYSPVLPTGGAAGGQLATAGSSSAGGGSGGGSARNVNVRIDSLIKNFNVNASSVSESLGDLKSKVTEVMIQALRDTELAIS